MQIILHIYAKFMESINIANTKFIERRIMETETYRSGIHHVNCDVQIAEEETNIHKVDFIYLEYEGIV